MALFERKERPSFSTDENPESLPAVEGQQGSKPSPEVPERKKSTVEEANSGSIAAEDFLMKHLPPIEE